MPMSTSSAKRVTRSSSLRDTMDTVTMSSKSSSTAKRITKKKLRVAVKEKSFSTIRQGSVTAIRDFKIQAGKVAYLVRRQGTETEDWEAEDVIDDLEVLSNYQQNVVKDSGYTISQWKSSNTTQDTNIVESTLTAPSLQNKSARASKVKALIAIKQQDLLINSDDEEEVYPRKRKYVGSSQGAERQSTASKRREHGLNRERKTKKQIIEAVQAAARAKRRIFRAELSLDDIMNELYHTNKVDCCLKCASNVYRDCLEKNDLEGFKAAISDTRCIPHYSNEDAPNGLDLISYAITLNKPEFLEVIHQSTIKKEAQRQRPQVPTKYTQYGDSTGHNSRGHMYAQRSFRDVQELRGNRLGNSAFYKGATNSSARNTFMNLENGLHSCNGFRPFMPFVSKHTFAVPEVVDLSVNFMKNNAMTFYFAVNSGNRLLASKLLMHLTENGGRQTFNHLHEEVLRNNSDEPLSSYRRPQILKMASDACNLSPFHCSAIHPSAEYLRVFYEALDPAERLQTDAYGRNVTFYAAVSETTACLEYLLSVGFNIQQHDKYKMTPLVQAARMGRSHNVELIIKHMKNTGGMTEETPALLFDTLMRNKRTVLHYAAYYGHANTCSLLIRYGAPVEKVESLDKQTALHYAAKNGYLDCVQILVEEGKADPEKGDKFGRNALHLACFYGQLDIVRYCLDQGVDANAADTSHNRPAHYAAAFGYIEILHLLLRYGQADPTVNNVWRSTPCSVANMKGHIAVVKYLLQLPGNPINVNFKDENGLTMLQHCIQESIDSESETKANLAKIKLLLSMSADGNSKDVHGNTSLHLLALNNSHISLQPKGWVSFYPQKVQNCWRSNPETSSKLFDDMLCIEYQNEVAKLLLEYKADMYIKNRQNETPFISAMANNHHHLVAEFIEAGYDLSMESNTTDSKGNNFFHYFGRLIAYVNSLRAYQEEDIIIQTRFMNVTKRIWRHIESALAKLQVVPRVAYTYINAVNDDGYTPLLLSVSTAIKLQKNAVTEDKKLIASAATEGTRTSTFGARPCNITVSNAFRKKVLEQGDPLTVDLTLRFTFYISMLESLINLTKPNLDAYITPPKEFNNNKEAQSKKIQYPRFTGYTALHFACQSHCPDLAKLLLKSGAQPNHRITIQNWSGDTAMILACHLKKDKRQERPDERLETLEFIDKKFTMNKPDFGLLLDKTIKYLLDYGASPYVAGENNKTPLMIASSNLFSNIVRDMCMVKPMPNENANAKDDQDQTAIMAAIDAWESKLKDDAVDVRTADLLLRNGADVNNQYNNTDTVLIKLIKLGYYPLIKTAIEESIKEIKHSYQNRERDTALTIACRINQQDTLQLYLEELKRASIVFDLNVFNVFGHTPLSYACKHGNANVVEQLLTMGAIPNICRPQCIPLHQAIQSGNLQSVKALVTHGADVNMADLDGDTPLHYAVNQNNFRMVNILLENSADCNRSNSKAQTPLHLAVEMAKKQTNRSFRIERSLMNAGAKINAVDFLGRTPLHYAFICMNTIPRTNRAVTILPKVERLRKELELEKKKKDRLETFVAKYSLDDQATKIENDLDAWLIEAKRKQIDQEMKLEDSLEKEDGSRVLLSNEDRQSLKPYLDCFWEKEDYIFDRFDPIDILQYLSNFDDLDHEAQDIFGRAPIHYAACVGAFSCTTLLLEKGNNVNMFDGDKNGPLQLALLNNHVDYSIMLCSSGASIYEDITLKDLSKSSTLGFALSKSLINIAYLIMNRNYEILPFIKDALVNGKFHMAETAIQSVNTEVFASALIKENKNNIWHVLANFKPFDSDIWSEYLNSIIPVISTLPQLITEDIYRRTPVHYAAMHGQDNLLTKMLRMGANINVTDEENLTELEYAVESGNINCVKILLDAGAMIRKRSDGITHKSALLKAAESSQLDMMKILLAHGEIPDNGDSANGWPNCVMTACLKEDIDMLYLLIKHDCNVNTPSYIERKRKDGKSYKLLLHPIFIASAMNNQQFLKVLLDAKGNPNVQGPESEPENGDSCFTYNVRSGLTENQELLLDYGVDLNNVDQSTGRSIFYTFLFESLHTIPPEDSTDTSHTSKALKINKKVFSKMMKMDPSKCPQPLEVNLVDERSGMLPLELTVRAENSVLTEFLISNGANVNLVSYGQLFRGPTAYPILNPSSQKLPVFLHALLQNNMAIVTLVFERAKDTINWLWQDKDGHNIISYLIGCVGGYFLVNLDMLRYITQHRLPTDILLTLLTMNDHKGLCAMDYVYRYRYHKIYNFFMELCPTLKDTFYPNIDTPATLSVLEGTEIVYEPITSVQVDEDANIERKNLREIAALKKKNTGESNGEQMEEAVSTEVDPYSRLQVAGVILIDEKNSCPYDIMLMKVELNSWGSYTNTSFYKLSIIYNTVLDVYVLWTRWGPFAQEGQHQKAPFLTKEDAVCEFKSIFKSKTGNDWNSHQVSFEKKAGRYEIMKTYHYPKDTLLENFDFLASNIETSLPKEILNLMKLICNYRYLSSVYLDMQIDMPLGQLPQSRIHDARKLLEETVNLIDLYNQASKKFNDKASLQQARVYAFQITQNCVEYSRLIPNARNDGSNIRSLYDGRKQLIFSELSRINDISYVGFAANVILAAKHHIEAINPLDYAYRALNCSLRPIQIVDINQPEYQMVKHYMETTMNYEQDSFGHYEILQAYGVNRIEEEMRFKPFENDHNRKLLWHGSRIGNFMGILKQGLRIRPRTTTTNGAMLGNGLYFADTFAKSMGYTKDYGRENQNADYRILLLCEVALGANQGVYINQAMDNYEQYDSVLGQGKYVPDPKNAIYDQTGLRIPMGPCAFYVPSNTDNAGSGAPYLQYNEYVVYNSDRVKIRYLLILKKSNICEVCGSSNNKTSLKPLHAYKLKDYKSTEFNPFEGAVIKALLSHSHETVELLLERLCDSINSGRYKRKLNVPLDLTGSSKVCGPCVNHTMSLILVNLLKRAHEVAIDVPHTLISRPRCKNGKECRTQKSSIHHAKTYQHWFMESIADKSNTTKAEREIAIDFMSEKQLNDTGESSEDDSLELDN